MSTSTLAAIQAPLSRYGTIICLILGNIGSCFIAILFSRRRSNACSIYLIGSAIANDVYLTFNGFLQLYPLYYGDGSIRAVALCKLRLYVANVTGQIANSMLILACIDRFLITSDRATYRALSTPKRAKWLIFISVVFWLLFCSHIAIMTPVINGQCRADGIYSTIYIIYTILFVGLIPPITLGIFGYLTYRHMRRMHTRVQPIAHRAGDENNSIRRQDRDLLLLVLSEVLVYVITTTPYPVMLSETIISGYVIPNKSFQQYAIEGFIFTFVYILLLLNNASPFYTYLMVSKSFRRDFKQLMINTYRKLTRQPPIRITHETTQPNF